MSWKRLKIAHSNGRPVKTPRKTSTPVRERGASPYGVDEPTNG
jgi:hypothetical protein